MWILVLFFLFSCSSPGHPGKAKHPPWLCQVLFIVSLSLCAHCVSTFRLKMTTFLCKEQQSLQPLAPAVLGQGFGLDEGSSQAPDLSAL